jgi:tetratricopeptide (TPR) repeat protein
LGGNDGDIHFYRGLHLVRAGKLRDASAETRKAAELAPANPVIIANLAGRYSNNGRDAEAVKYADLAIELGFPRDTAPLPGVCSNAALRAKRYAEAAEIDAKQFVLSDPERAQSIKLVYAALADPCQRARALAALGRLYPARAPLIQPADHRQCVAAHQKAQSHPVGRRLFRGAARAELFAHSYEWPEIVGQILLALLVLGFLFTLVKHVLQRLTESATQMRKFQVGPIGAAILAASDGPNHFAIENAKPR